MMQYQKNKDKNGNYCYYAVGYPCPFYYRNDCKHCNIPISLHLRDIADILRRKFNLR